MSDVTGLVMILVLCSPIALIFYGAKKSAESDARKRRGVTGVGTRGYQRELLKMGRAQQAPVRITNAKRPTNSDLPMPGLLYVVSHPQMNAAKVGITRAASNADRVGEHLKRGWKLESYWSFQNFGDAEATEGAILAWLRNDRCLPMACSPQQMPQGGHTETVPLSEIELGAISDKISEIAGLCDGGVVTSAAIEGLIVGTYMRVQGKIEATMGISGPGDHRRRRVTWQRVLVSDSSGQLVVELSGNRRLREYPALIGTPVDLVGRVELFEDVYRMTNPSLALREQNH